MYGAGQLTEELVAETLAPLDNRSTLRLEIVSRTWKKYFMRPRFWSSVFNAEWRPRVYRPVSDSHIDAPVSETQSDPSLPASCLGYHISRMSLATTHPPEALAVEADNRRRYRHWNSGQPRSQSTIQVDRFGITALRCVNNTTVWTAAQESGLKQWDLVTEACMETIQDACLIDVVYADERVVLTAGLDRALKLWDVRQREPVHVQEQAHDDEIFCLERADDNTFVSGGGDDMVKVWDWRSWVSREYEGHGGTVFSLAFCGPNRLYSGGGDHKICVWDLRRDENIAQLLGHHGHVYTLGIYDNRMVSGADDGHLIQWRVGSDIQYQDLDAEDDDEERDVWADYDVEEESTPNNASGSHEAQVEPTVDPAVDILAQQEVKRFRANTSSISSLQLLGNEKVIFSTWEGFVQVWDGHSADVPLWSLPANGSTLACTDTHILCGGSDGNLNIFSMC
eukprot:GILK01006010.1.p1 GENE.GILK01006010.1~~GILK01006010.1.p1  ORF type:complete len:452 (-),score=58.44 GILK01006010.1:189-1544(-)